MSDRFTLLGSKEIEENAKRFFRVRTLPGSYACNNVKSMSCGGKSETQISTAVDSTSTTQFGECNGRCYKACGLPHLPEISWTRR